ncbi:uncharacterized protein LY89DRAFT_325364 [Mollisia scopiformis]|uniref:Uncharacterized protein n=1 Tax=Mollisia scopiformis TaxID=149040 RepID=A0A132B906_MOLSC|nr:uncharacterized protein LY89DRAFT_325364 [Mollisia scopiformis]KUJ08733.1 hypothetical protein LY89DRAFT_325364 [Mollisia scopiformis]
MCARLSLFSSTLLSYQNPLPTPLSSSLSPLLGSLKHGACELISKSIVSSHSSSSLHVKQITHLTSDGEFFKIKKPIVGPGRTPNSTRTDWIPITWSRRGTSLAQKNHVRPPARTHTRGDIRLYMRLASSAESEIGGASYRIQQHHRNASFSYSGGCFLIQRSLDTETLCYLAPILPCHLTLFWGGELRNWGSWRLLAWLLVFRRRIGRK